MRKAGLKVHGQMCASRGGAAPGEKGEGESPVRAGKR